MGKVWTMQDEEDKDARAKTLSGSGTVTCLSYLVSTAFPNQETKCAHRQHQQYNPSKSSIYCFLSFNSPLSFTIFAIPIPTSVPNFSNPSITPARSPTPIS